MENKKTGKPRKRGQEKGSELMKRDSEGKEGKER